MQVTVSVIDKVLWKGDALSITVPGVDGEMTILPHHAPLITLLRKGQIRIKHKDGVEKENIESGFLSVNDNELVVLIQARTE
jgi:F-type H+-transporting ATPase subunit epsilon